MQAILFAFLAICSCTVAAPSRQKRSATAIASAGGFYPDYFWSTLGFPLSFSFPRPRWPIPFFSPLPLLWNPIKISMPPDWVKGPNVCNKTKVFESSDEVMEDMKDDATFFSSYQSTGKTCNGVDGKYTCMESKMTDGNMQITKIKYFCCDGYEYGPVSYGGGWKFGCDEKPKVEGGSQIPPNEEQKVEPTKSPSGWDRMKYEIINDPSGVDGVPAQ